MKIILDIYECLTWIIVPKVNLNTVMLPQSNEANRQALKKSLNCLALLKTHATGTRITCVIINKMQISMHL